MQVERCVQQRLQVALAFHWLVGGASTRLGHAGPWS